MCKENDDELSNKIATEHPFTEHDQEAWNIFLQLNVKKETAYEGLGN